MKRITNLPELLALSQRLKKFDIYRKPEEYRFQLPGWSEEENYRNSLLMTSYSKECRCSTSGYVISAALVVAVVYSLSGSNFFIDLSTEKCLWLAFFVVLALLTGKLSGLVFARRKMIRLAADVLARQEEYIRQSIISDRLTN